MAMVINETDDIVKRGCSLFVNGDFSRDDLVAFSQHLNPISHAVSTMSASDFTNDLKVILLESCTNELLIAISYWRQLKSRNNIILNF